eukprot:GHVP01055430.1.p1 GENE.GHVP01055430.1~~GHVP01055430.1.p1  ORF type:complete len:299 (+),score=68.09 GHVP01055430.1:55-951(+)
MAKYSEPKIGKMNYEAAEPIKGNFRCITCFFLKITEQEQKDHCQHKMVEEKGAEQALRLIIRNSMGNLSTLLAQTNKSTYHLEEKNRNLDVQLNDTRKELRELLENHRNRCINIIEKGDEVLGGLHNEILTYHKKITIEKTRIEKVLRQGSQNYSAGIDEFAVLLREKREENFEKNERARMNRILSDSNAHLWDMNSRTSVSYSTKDLIESAEKVRNVVLPKLDFKGTVLTEERIIYEKEEKEESQCTKKKLICLDNNRNIWKICEFVVNFSTSRFFVKINNKEESNGESVCGFKNKF